MCGWSETKTMGKWHDCIDGTGRWIQCVIEAESMEAYWIRMSAPLGVVDPPHPKPRRVKYFKLRDEVEAEKAIVALKRSAWQVEACVNVKPWKNAA